MATFHIHPMLLLLASLFFLPTLRAVDYTDCGIGKSRIEIINVDVFRKQEGTSFKILVFSSKNITGADMNVSIKLGPVPALQKTYDLCENTECPIAVGFFVIHIDKVILFVPKARFSVHIDMFDDDEEKLMYLNFNFQLSSSSTAVVSA